MLRGLPVLNMTVLMIATIVCNGERRMSREEKLASWKGQRVVLLPGQYIAGLFPEGKERDYSASLPLSYLHKPGTIVEVLHPSDKEPGLLIELDGSKERVVAKSDLFVGFEAEFQRAESFVGKTLWTKGQLVLQEAGADPTNSNDRRYLPVAPAQNVVVSSAGWGVHWNPVFLRLTLPDGRQGDFYFGTRRCLDERFHVSSESDTAVCEGGSWRLSTNFFEADPHRLYASWDQGIWRAVEKGIVGVGMSKEMVLVACGELEESGVMVVNNKSNPIYSCRHYENGGWETTHLLMDGDKVSRVAKNLQDLMR
jgi:hypothetical protein